MKLSELFDLSNLEGFRIGIGFEVGFRRNDMEKFPALISKTRKPFFCADRETTERAVNLLPYRPHEIKALLLLMNEKKKIAFRLEAPSDHIACEERKSYLFITQEEAKKWRVGDLRWAYRPRRPDLF